MIDTFTPTQSMFVCKNGRGDYVQAKDFAEIETDLQAVLIAAQMVKDADPGNKWAAEATLNSVLNWCLQKHKRLTKP